MVGRGKTFALRVKGMSMQDEGIFSGDVVVVQKQATVRNGQTVIALVNGEATIKTYYRKTGTIRTASRERCHAADHHQAVGQLPDRRHCRRRHPSSPKVRPRLLAPWTAKLSALVFLLLRSPSRGFSIPAFQRDHWRSPL